MHRISRPLPSPPFPRSTRLTQLAHEPVFFPPSLFFAAVFHNLGIGPTGSTTPPLTGSGTCGSSMLCDGIVPKGVSMGGVVRIWAGGLVAPPPAGTSTSGPGAGSKFGSVTFFGLTLNQGVLMAGVMMTLKGFLAFKHSSPGPPCPSVPSSGISAQHLNLLWGPGNLGVGLHSGWVFLK